VFTTSMNSTSD